MRTLTLLRNVYRPLVLRSVRQLSVAYGNPDTLSPKVQQFINEKVALCKPAAVHICDGSDSEAQMLADVLIKSGTFTKLEKHENCYLARTDPRDVARVESKTLICTPEQREAIPTPAEGVQGTLGKWQDPDIMMESLNEKFNGCMEGRTMYVMPFSMGPVGSPLSKIGIQLTDSPYTVSSMRVMTRMGSKVAETLGDGDFIKCLHSVGYPLSNGREDVSWPCNPDETVITHFPQNDEIISFGSGYGGNSLLGKKCFALRLGSILAKKEGWLAEHMLILGITNPAGVKKYIAAAFPSACGKTNLAMMKPSLPGWEVECVGDDIAWMRFDDAGVLRAINPENGFFGVAPGTSDETNPQAMATIQKNTVFTNVAKTSDGGVFWEGLEKEVDLSNLSVTSWLGEENWTKESGKPSSHPNSRFCTPSGQCPVIDPAWEDPAGVPISAILFGGRRPTTIPLVLEANSWKHGVLLGASMRSEATAAAEHGGKMIMHDPFAMRPFFGYNFGDYLKHWLSFGDDENLQLPQIFHVNWFRKADGKFIWPGFGDNSRVLEWIFDRTGNADNGEATPVGILPKAGSINMEGLPPVDMETLLSVDRDEWLSECDAVQKYFNEQIPHDTPAQLQDELDNLRSRLNCEHLQSSIEA